MAMEELDLSSFSTKQTKDIMLDDDDQEEALELDLDTLAEMDDDDDEEDLLDDTDDVEEEDDDDDEEEEQEDSDDDVEEEEDDDDEEEDSDDDDDDDPKKEEGRTRYNKRIQQVITQRNAEREKAQKAAQSQQEWEQKYQDLQNEMVESQKILLAQNKDAIKAAILRANEEGKTSEAIDLQEQLTQVTTQLQAYEAWKPVEKPKETTNTNDVDGNKIPEALQDWLTDNPWFQSPENDDDIERAALADAYSRVLIQKGYTYDDPELYEIVDEKINKKLAKDDKEMVESKKSSEKDVKAKQEVRKKKKKVSQNVQGASRTSPDSSSKDSRKSPKKVTLSVEEQRIADVMGISYREYADELLRIEASEKQGSRMTELKINNKRKGN